MRDIAFYNEGYATDADVIECEVFLSGTRGQRGLQLHVAGLAIVDAWLDEGESVADAEQALRDMCALRRGAGCD